MQRISSLLQKLNELANKNNEPDLIDIDLMLDYTKVMYADLLELRSRKAFNNPVGIQSKNPSEVASSESTTHIIPEIISEPEQGVIVPEPILQSVKPLHSESGKDIKQLIGINDKYLYISELFGNDKDAYDRMIARVNEFTNYEEAVTWLDTEVHSANNWNDENETVQSFYGTLNSFFASR